MTRYIKKETTIERNIVEVFDALVSPGSIKQWWQANSAIVLPEAGGFYAAAWGENPDDPDFITLATIERIEQPYRLHLLYDRYFSKNGPLPFEAKMEVVFTLEEAGEGTLLAVVQDGFPISMAADEYYHGCVQGWEDTLLGIKLFLEK